RIQSDLLRPVEGGDRRAPEGAWLRRRTRIRRPAVRRVVRALQPLAGGLCRGGGRADRRGRVAQRGRPDQQSLASVARIWRRSAVEGRDGGATDSRERSAQGIVRSAGAKARRLSARR